MSNKQPQLLNEFLDAFISNPFGFMFGAHFLQSIMSGGSVGSFAGEQDEWLQRQPQLPALLDKVGEMEEDEIASLMKKDPDVAKAMKDALGEMPEGLQSEMMGEIQISAAKSFSELKDSIETFYAAMTDSLEQVGKVEPFASMGPEEQKKAQEIIKKVISPAVADVTKQIIVMDNAIAEIVEEKDSPVGEKAKKELKAQGIGTYKDTYNDGEGSLTEIDSTTPELADSVPTITARPVLEEAEAPGAGWEKKMFAKVSQALSLMEKDLKAFGNYMTSEPPPLKMAKASFMPWFNNTNKLLDGIDSALFKRMPDMVARELKMDQRRASDSAPSNLDKLSDKDKVEYIQKLVQGMQNAYVEGDSETLKKSMETLKHLNPKVAQQAAKKFGLTLQENLRNFYESFGDFS